MCWEFRAEHSTGFASEGEETDLRQTDMKIQYVLWGSSARLGGGAVRVLIVEDTLLKQELRAKGCKRSGKGFPA